MLHDSDAVFIIEKQKRVFNEMTRSTCQNARYVRNQLLAVLVFLVSFALLFLFLFFIARGQKTAEIEVTKAAEKLVGEQDASKIKKENELTLRARYGLEPEAYVEMAYYGPVSNMDVEELLLLKLRDPSQAESIRAAFNSRIDYQKSCFDGYGTDQMGILANAKIVIKGSYACLIISENSEAMSAQMQTFLRKGVQDGIQ